MAKGTTDDNGDYQLTSYKENDGAYIGTHVVTIFPMGDPSSVAPIVPADQEALNKSLDESRQSGAMQKKQLETKPPFPIKYTDANTSDLRKEVKAGENVIDLELVD